jgi:hypothetical protein
MSVEPLTVRVLKVLLAKGGVPQSVTEVWSAVCDLWGEYTSEAVGTALIAVAKGRDVPPGVGVYVKRNDRGQPIAWSAGMAPGTPIPANLVIGAAKPAAAPERSQEEGQAPEVVSPAETKYLAEWAARTAANIRTAKGEPSTAPVPMPAAAQVTTAPEASKATKTDSERRRQEVFAVLPTMPGDAMTAKQLAGYLDGFTALQVGAVLRGLIKSPPAGWTVWKVNGTPATYFAQAESQPAATPAEKAAEKAAFKPAEKAAEKAAEAKGGWKDVLLEMFGGLLDRCSAQDVADFAQDAIKLLLQARAALPGGEPAKAEPEAEPAKAEPAKAEVKAPKPPKVAKAPKSEPRPDQPAEAEAKSEEGLAPTMYVPKADPKDDLELAAEIRERIDRVVRHLADGPKIDNAYVEGELLGMVGRLMGEPAKQA